MEPTWEVPLTSSAIEYADRRKPSAWQAILRFDPDLRLVWNRRLNMYQVCRVIPRLRRMWLNGYGPLSFLDRVLFHVTDWTEGLMGQEDPEPLLKALYDGDTWRHGVKELNDRLDQKHYDYRDRQRANARDIAHHTFRSNRYQLARGFEDFLRSASLMA